MGATTTPALPAHLRTLEQALDRAERRAVALLLSHAAPAAGTAPWPFGVLEDHRVEVLGDVADALECLLPGAGRRLMQIVYPEHTHMDGDDLPPPEALAALLAHLGDPELPDTPHAAHPAPERTQ
ncbi:MAG: hypothetical protein KF683_05000 [Rubrivivax sp.]|nr:hypothetical protein [Rubrivivax sp.]